MLKLVTGTKGKGKTKILLDTCNADGKTNDGLVVYLSKNNEHMYQLDRKIRHVNVTEYQISTVDGIIGFISGLVAGNSDINAIYFDSFLTVTTIPDDKIEDALDGVSALSSRLEADIILSISMDSDSLPEKYKDNILQSL